MGWYSCNKQPCIQWHVTTYPFPSLFVYVYTYRMVFATQTDLTHIYTTTTPVFSPPFEFHMQIPSPVLQEASHPQLPSVHCQLPCGHGCTRKGRAQEAQVCQLSQAAAKVGCLSPLPASPPLETSPEIPSVPSLLAGEQWPLTFNLCDYTFPSNFYGRGKFFSSLPRWK